MKKLLLSFALIACAPAFAAQKAESSLSHLEENFKAFEALEEGNDVPLHEGHPRLAKIRHEAVRAYTIATITKDMFDGIWQKARDVNVSDEEFIALIENLTQKNRELDELKNVALLRKKEGIDFYDLVDNEDRRQNYIFCGQCWQMIGLSNNNNLQQSIDAVTTLKRLYDSINTIELDRLFQFKFAD